MSAFPLQRWAIRIGPGSCAHEPLVLRCWRRGSGEGRPPGRWLAERSSEHSERRLPSVRSPALGVTRCPPTLQGAVEPMQIDVDPQEDPQNTPDVNYVVENPTLVGPAGGPPGEACQSRRGGQARLLTLAVSFCDPETSRVSNCPLMKGLCTPLLPARKGLRARPPCMLSHHEDRSSLRPSL